MNKRAGKLPAKLSDLKPSPTNPRKMDTQALKGLSYSIDAFGDLGGIVWNKRSRHIVSGHQRLKVLKEKYGDLKIKFSENTNGDEITGKIETKTGESFSLRVVDWNEQMERAANLSANNPAIQGSFDDSTTQLLAEMNRDDTDLFKKLGLESLANDLSIPCSVRRLILR